MVRSMYSGVSGLRTHQTRMDTIGNNIANVNTYGFKSARTTFRDIYYQQISAASSPTAANGGTNPSAVGYGTQIGSVDLMMGRSTFTMTDQTMDLAVDGEGFFQVMDGSGNIYYTRAGMLNFDAEGNLVDMQGNFVLGVNGNPSGRAPASERIQVALPNVQPTPGRVTQTINGKNFTITASNNTTDSNLNFNFTTDSSLADGEMVASLSSTGIIIKMHPDNVYASWGAFSAAVNSAVTVANGGIQHPAGSFNITSTDPLNNRTANEIASTDFGIQMGSLPWPTTATNWFGGMQPTKVGNTFSASGQVQSFNCNFIAGNIWEVTIDVGGTTYRGTIDSTRTSSGEFVLRNTAAGASDTDTITMSRPSYNDLITAWQNDAPANVGQTPVAGTSAFLGKTSADFTGVNNATASTPSRALGFSGTSFALRGGTAGGPQTIADMTGISIAPNGIILGYDSVGAEIMIGRIDLATFANPSGLDQAGSSKYAQSSNSGVAQLSQPGTSGSGRLVGGSLELSNVDLSREFSDMITTQRGYQANSRIITVSDTMLEELINLKR